MSLCIFFDVWIYINVCSHESYLLPYMELNIFLMLRNCLYRLLGLLPFAQWLQLLSLPLTELQARCNSIGNEFFDRDCVLTDDEIDPPADIEDAGCLPSYSNFPSIYDVAVGAR